MLPNSTYTDIDHPKHPLTNWMILRRPPEAETNPYAGYQMAYEVKKLMYVLPKNCARLVQILFLSFSISTILSLSLS